MQNRPGNWVYITILTLVPLLIGLFTFNEYGESLDEAPLYEYSSRSLQAYHGLLSFEFNPDLGRGNFRYYGPAFLMIANAGAHLIAGLFGAINLIDAWHLTYFLSFLGGVLGFYLIARRWFSNQTAFATTLLFLFQPLLWGHAFINPKDIPFMSFCILSLLAGLIMQDKLFPEQTPWNIPTPKSLILIWQKAEGKQRSRLLWNSLGLISIVVVVFLGQHWIEKIASAMLATAYASEGNIFSVLLAAVAKNYKTIPPESYVPKVMKFINGSLVVLLALFTFKTFSYGWEIFTQIKLKPRTVVSDFIHDTLRSLKHPWIPIAGVTLGLTASVRILGPVMGGMVFVIAIYRAKSRAVPAFTAYFLIAALTTYATWPYLWNDTFHRFQIILSYMSDFPWAGKVLFNGIYYPTDELPLGYVPGLLAVQYTEPAIVLFVGGLIILAYKTWKRIINFELATLLILWGILPVIAFTILRPALYDNTRQLLLIIPALFLFTGFSLEWIFQQIQSSFTQYLILSLLLLPGLYAIWNLHPYQYTYYNSLVQTGGRRFESDYWAISFREATEYLNQTAPANSKVVVYGTNTNGVKHYSRPDLIVDSYRGGSFDPASGYDYAIITSRYEWDLYTLEEWQTIYTIERQHNVFSVVKKRP